MSCWKIAHNLFAYKLANTREMAKSVGHQNNQNELSTLFYITYNNVYIYTGAYRYATVAHTHLQLSLNESNYPFIYELKQARK